MNDPDQFTFLDRLNLERKITPDRERPEPALWFKELRILDHLTPIVERRRITLHRGFNILWAAPEDPDAEQGLYRDGLAGHASGKTLFCRILRHILGEDPFGTEAQRTGIARRFLRLWVVALVRVNGHSWVVGRPLATDGEKFAVRAESIDQALSAETPAGGYDDFLKWVKKLGEPVERLYPDEGWRHLFPWLARDQEARFSNLVAWRESASQGDNPQMKVADRHQVMRAVLGLLDQTEADLRKTVEAGSTTLEAWRQRAQMADAQITGRVAMVNESVVSLLGKDAPTDVAAIKERLSALADVIRDGAEALAQRPPSPAVSAAEIQLKDAERLLDAAEAEWKRLSEELPKQIKRSEENLTLLGQIKFGSAVDPARVDSDFCPHSIHTARARKCYVDGKPSDESAEAIAKLEEQASEQTREIETRKQRLVELEKGLPALRSNKTRASLELEKARVAANRDVAALLTRAARADQVRQLFHAIDEAQKKQTGETKKLTKKTEELEAAKAEIARLRRDMEERVKLFSATFADIIRAVMGASVEPSIALTGDGLIPHVERKGELSGAALDTIKTLAFDLAAVVASIEGRGAHPRFLIHDGPREGDMARVIYNRFFLYAAGIEKAFRTADDSSFQYIITTTTPPPDTMREGTRWLLDPVLDSRDKEKRLLKEDF